MGSEGELTRVACVAWPKILGVIVECDVLRQGLKLLAADVSICFARVQSQEATLEVHSDHARYKT